MNNLQKRILTSVIALPLSLSLIIIGDFPLAFFLVFILFAGIHELFTVFKKTPIKLFLSLILILSLFSTYHLREVGPLLLYFAIAISISSDIGGYVFGKIFKGKKLTKISPNKTVSGVFGSYFFSFLCLYVYQYYLEAIGGYRFNIAFLFEINEILLTIILSTVSQVGDLTISYFKRIDKIKDTGKILPGHGGIFDRIDGLVFVIILTFVLFYVTRHL